jgi:hypothetical protein
MDIKSSNEIIRLSEVMALIPCSHAYCSNLEQLISNANRLHVSH